MKWIAVVAIIVVALFAGLFWLLALAGSDE